VITEQATTEQPGDSSADGPDGYRPWRSDLVARVGAAFTRRSPGPAATYLHWASLLVALPLLLWIDRHQWFAGDEWDFLVRRGVLGHSELGLWQPHNEHWSTLPILIYRVLFAVFGVRTYLPYALVLVLFHLLVAHLLWRLMLRAGVDWLVATGAAAVFMVLGAGWEDLVNAFQLTFVASLAFGLLALLVIPEKGPFQRRDAWGWLCIVVSMLFSGVGLTMMLIAAVTTFLRRGWRLALAALSVPGAVYIVWYVAY
jgi:hypothetical protein